MNLLFKFVSVAVALFLAGSIYAGVNCSKLKAKECAANKSCAWKASKCEKSTTSKKKLSKTKKPKKAAAPIEESYPDDEPMPSGDNDIGLDDESGDF